MSRGWQLTEPVEQDEAEAGVGAAVAATGVAGASTSASAGCGITLELHNRRSAAVTIDWQDSDVRTGGVGWWKRLGSGTTYVAAGDTVRQNFTADFGCGYEREYRLDVNQGSSSSFVYHGSTLDVAPHIHID